MDPLSISASCVSLVATITKVSYSVTVFVREVRDARSDLDLISHELHSLKTVLELLGDDFAQPTSSALPSTLVTHLGGILKNCAIVVNDIEQSLEKHRSSRLGVGGRWTLGGGKDDMTKFRFSLETHKSALELALEMVAITIIRDVKKDTEAIREDTAAIPDIKNDTTQILQIVEEIARLKARLPEDVTQSGPNLMLQRFLDDSTTYAETVVNDSVADEPESPVFDTSAHDTDWSNDYRGYLGDGQSSSISRPLPYDYRGNSQRSTNRLESVFAGMDLKTDMRAFNIPSRSQTVISPAEDGQTASPNRPPEEPKSSLSPWTNEKSLEKSLAGIESEMPHLMLNPTDIYYPQVAPNALSTNTQQVEVPLPAESRRMSPKEYDSLVARLGIDRKYFSLQHLVLPLGEGGITNWNTHRYTVLSCTPSELAKTDFTFRQTSQQRETMLMIGVHCCRDPLTDEEFDARVGTTLGSIVKGLSHIKERCGATRSRLPWGETVVVCMLHNHLSYSKNLGAKALWAMCSSYARVHNCGVPLDYFEDDKIYAHMWEVTSSTTKFSLDRKGRARMPEPGSVHLQIINFVYAKPSHDSGIPGDEQHLSPFIQMLGARSCISIMAGDKIGLDDVLDAYKITSSTLSTIQASSELEEDMYIINGHSYTYIYNGVPTKVYVAERASNSTAEKPTAEKPTAEKLSLRTRMKMSVKKERIRRNN